MTERDINIVCGIIVSSHLDFAGKQRLCDEIRELAAHGGRQEANKTTSCTCLPDGYGRRYDCPTHGKAGRSAAGAETPAQKENQ